MIELAVLALVLVVDRSYVPTKPAKEDSLLKQMIANRLLYVEPYLLELAAIDASVVVVVVVVVVVGTLSLIVVVPM